MNSELVRNIATIDDALRKYTGSYFNSNVFFESPDASSGVRVPYDLNDLMLIGALTRSDVLLSGATGSGKSHLSRMVMNGLYGEDGFANLTVTPGLNESDFVDIDIPAIKRGEKSVKEAIGKTPILTNPGAIINEINRTPEVLQNLFISYLERIFSLKGIEFPVGVEMIKDKDSPQDPHYQFRIISINEGDQYSGTSGIDKAVRDRVAIEIPMDYFGPRKEDVRRIIQERNDSDLSIDIVNGGNLDTIMDSLQHVEDIPLSASAQEFLAYFEGMDNCIKSDTKSKKGIRFDPKEMCDGCKHAKDQESEYENVCGSVYAPSERSLINLKKVAKAVTALRTYKVVDAIAKGKIDPEGDSKDFVQELVENSEVTAEDVAQIAPFILTGKMPTDRTFVGQNFQGSSYLAAQHIVGNVLAKFKGFVGSNAYDALAKSNGTLTDEASKQLREYATKTDPWAFSLNDLDKRPYNQGSPSDRKTEIGDLL